MIKHLKDNSGINYGGKANSLIKLRDNHFNVPSFFVIESDDFKSFLDSNNLIDEIPKMLKKHDYKEIKKLILSKEINDKLKLKIKREFKKLKSKTVSVRSSASNEDGTSKSFAGQYETYLDVSFDNIYDCIKKCWASLYDENVIEYSKEANLYGMNVVIQKMINPDYAGVAFSNDPTRDTNNYSLVEMVHGTGEKLVSGQVTPTKFLIRRQSLNVDFKIGEININKKVLNKLEKIILKIEEAYDTSMDIEFAITNKTIYILQARPITATSPVNKGFTLTISRPKSIIEEQVYFMGEYRGIKNVTRGMYYFKPLFMYRPENSNVDIYYNCQDLEEDPGMMYYYMDLDFNKIKKYVKKAEDNINYINNIIDNNLDFNLDEYIEKISEIYPLSSLGQLAGHFDAVSDRLRNLLYDYRNKYDYIIYKSEDYLVDYIKDKLSEKYKKYINFITLEEFKNSMLPSISELEKRKKGYIYYEKLYVVEDYEAWLKNNKMYIQDDEESKDGTLEGQVAYPGKIIGKVCKVFSERDFDKFNEGNILVTPMTTPKFTKLVKKASGIVTDEGGVTCHASIVSRELKIPCIVGCKNATKVLNDGDEIIIDTDKNKVYINN